MHKFLLGVLVGIAGTIGTCLAIDKFETKNSLNYTDDDSELEEESVTEQRDDS